MQVSANLHDSGAESPVNQTKIAAVTVINMLADLIYNSRTHLRGNQRLNLDWNNGLADSEILGYRLYIRSQSRHNISLLGHFSFVPPNF